MKTTPFALKFATATNNVPRSGQFDEDLELWQDTASSSARQDDEIGSEPHASYYYTYTYSYTYSYYTYYTY